MPIQVLRTFSVTARSAFVSLHDGSALQPSPHLPRLAAGDTLPTRRDSRGASPWRASFRSFAPPQNCFLSLPPAAVTVLPLRRCSALYVVTPRTRVRAVDICSVSACAPGALRRTPTLRFGRYLPAALLGALFLLRKHAPFFCPRQRSRICPLWGTRGSRLSARRASAIHGAVQSRLDAGSSRLARVCGRSVFPPSRYAGTSAARSSRHSSLREIPPCTHGSDAVCSHASRRAAVGSTGTLHACARPIDNDSVSACAPGTACRASTLRCVVISLRTGFSASYFLRLAMPVQVLRTFPATARCALVSPASLLGAVSSIRA